MDTGCVAQADCYATPVPAATRTAVNAFVAAVVSNLATPRFGATHPVAATAGPWSGAAFF